MYGILSADREEMKIGGAFRTQDYEKAYRHFCMLRGVVICFFVQWLSKDVFVVIEEAQ